MADEPPLAKPVLGYATPDADGLPEFIPEAEVLISSGKPPKALRHLFPNTQQAVRYFGKSMSRRYSESQLGAGCIQCNSATAEWVIKLGWTATSPFRLTESRMTHSAAQSSYTTLHAICPRCARAWCNQIYRCSRLRRILSWSLVGYALLWLIISAAGHFALGRHFKDQAAILLALLLPTFLLLIILNFLSALRNPQKARNLAVADVELDGIKCLFTREDGHLRAIYG